MSHTSSHIFTQIDKSGNKKMKSKLTMHLLFSLLLTISTLFFFTSLSHSQNVTVTIGSGSGAPNSKNNPVMIMLDNSIRLQGFQLALKDNKDYLTATGGKAIGRTSTLDLEVSEQTYGWTILHLYSFFGGGMIEEGSGPVAIINFDVKSSAPPGECIALRVLEKGGNTTSKYQDEDGNDLPITFVSGRFCFTDADEDDDDDEEDDTNTTTSTSDSSNNLTEGSSIAERSNQGRATSRLSSNTSQANSPRGSSQLTYGNSRRTTPTAPDTSGSTRKTIQSTQESAGRSPSGTNAVVTDSGSSPTRVIVSPEAVTLTSGDLIALDPQTIDGGIKVEGNYSYEIIPPSPIGSLIDEEGVFTAGINTSPSNIEETIKVTDTANENATAFVLIIVAGRKQPSSACELSISPLSATLSPEDSITFSAKTLGKKCSEGLYEWKVNSKIGSSINAQGLYKAGKNSSSTPALDIIMVTDTVNRVSTDAIIKVAGASSDTLKPQPAGVSGIKIYPKILIALTILTIFGGIIVIRKFKQ